MAFVKTPMDKNTRMLILSVEDRDKKEKYSEYCSEQVIEAINRCSELYREYIVFKLVFDCGT